MFYNTESKSNERITHLYLNILQISIRIIYTIVVSVFIMYNNTWY